MGEAGKARHRMCSYGPPMASMMEESYDYNDSAFQRPRRPKPETLSYCKVLPLSLQQAQTELKEYEHEVNELLKTDETNESSEKRELTISDDEKMSMMESLLPSRFAAQSAIDEVQNEIASLAGDEMGSTIMETLARIVCLPSSSKDMKMNVSPDTRSIEKLLGGLQGYHLHLASHRYGSHVVQTILQCAAKCLEGEDNNSFFMENTKNDDTYEKDRIPLYELICNVANELVPHAKELAVHVCGSHVLRTLLYVLAGVKVNERSNNMSSASSIPLDKRGKPKKKKKKKTQIMPDSHTNLAKNGSLPLLKSHHYRDSVMKEKFHNCLSQFVNSFVSQQYNDDKKHIDNIQIGYELQALICHPSAGPLLSILVRVLCIIESEEHDPVYDKSHTTNNETSERDYRLLGILPKEAQYKEGSIADKFVKAALCWDLHDVSVDKQQKESINTGDIIYGLSGEPTGSIFLETILRSCESNEFYDEFGKRAGFFSTKALQDYVQHSVSNFVIQTLLMTCRTKEHAEKLSKDLIPCILPTYQDDKKSKQNLNDQPETNNDNQNMNGQNDDSLPLLLQKKRRGVLWRLTELCSKWKVSQETLINSICIGFAQQIDENEKEDLEQQSNENTSGSKKRKRKKKLKSIPIDECIRKLLQINMSNEYKGRISLDVNGSRTVFHMLNFIPRLCSDVLDTLINKLTIDEIMKISMDGLGSRCISDAILTNPSISIAPFSTYIPTLCSKLEGNWTSLSVDRVGHHMVKNMFHALPTLDLKLNLVIELGQNINRLNGNAMGRSIMNECSIHDFMRGGEYTWRDIVTKKMKQKEWLDELGTGKDNDDIDATKKKKRRKRKRKADEGVSNEQENNHIQSNNDVDKKASVVSSIMDTLIMPSQNNPLVENETNAEKKSEKNTKRKRRKKKKQ